MSNNDHNKLNLGDQSDFWGKTSRFALIASALGYMGAPGIASANDDIQQEAPSAQAQSEPESDRNLIIVTATKREQSIVETPIAVTVVDAEMLVRTGVSDITNLERAAASYQMNSSDSTTGGLTLRLRGIGTTGNNIGIESSVGAFVDGFYIPRPGAVLGELNDVQQVEVLRGPQGTLFGRNTSAGALVIKTNKPNLDDTEAFFDVSAGNYDLFKVRGGFNVPVSEGKVALRVSGSHAVRDGYVIGPDGYDSSSIDRSSVRGQLLFDLEDAGVLRLFAGYSRGDDQCCSAVWLNHSPFIQANSAPFSAFGGTAGADFVGRRALKEGLANDSNYTNPYNGWNVGATYDVELPFANLSYLGYYGESNADSCRGDYTSLEIYAVGPCPEAEAILPNVDLDALNGTTIKSTSHELRLQGNAFEDSLDWLIGAYYSHEKIDQRYALVFLRDMQAGVSVGAFGQPVFNELNFASNGVDAAGDYAAPRAQQDGSSFSVFTHNVLELTDGLNLTLGARYITEKKDAQVGHQVPGQHNACEETFNNLTSLTSPNFGLYNGTNGFFGARGPARLASVVQSNCWIFNSGLYDPSDPNNFFTQFANTNAANTFVTSYLNLIPQPFDRDFKDDQLTYTANLSYEVADQTFVYGGFTHGFKSGGFNLDVSAAVGGADPRFRSEKIDAFELGFKSVFLNNRAWANIALFYSDLSDFQVLEFDGTRFSTFNVDKARSKGVEFESAYALSDALSLNLAATYTDAKYPDDCTTFDPTDANFNGSVTALCGQQFTNAPKLVVIGGANVDTEINTSGASMFAGFSVRYESKRRTSTLPTERPATFGLTTEAQVRDAVAAAIAAPFDIQKSNAKLDLRLGFRTANEKFTIEAWARNFFDVRTRFLTFHIPLRGFSGQRARGAFVQEPRTYGLTLRGKF